MRGGESDADLLTLGTDDDDDQVKKSVGSRRSAQADVFSAGRGYIRRLWVIGNVN